MIWHSKARWSVGSIQLHRAFFVFQRVNSSHAMGKAEMCSPMRS